VNRAINILRNEPDPEIDDPGDDPVVVPASFEPTPEDWASFHAWYREQDERDRDLEEAYRESQYQDWLERSCRFSDADLIAAGQYPG
jgi:hypothetical protein